MTTSCDTVRFSKLGDKLAFSSKWKDNAIRIVNLNSLKIDNSFPPKNYSIKVPLCLDFSSNDEYFSIGNADGRALLFKYNK